MAKLLVPAPTHHRVHQTSLLAPAAAGFSPYSPHSAAPPPAHQSPRHVPFAAHPLPAHLHPVLSAASGFPHASLAAAAAGQIHPPLAYVNSPSGGAYLAHAVSPTKTRQLQYQYLYDDSGIF